MRTQSDVCEHGVSTEDFCADCAHQPAEEWVGYPMTICAYCIVQWPCEYALARSTSFAAALFPEDSA